MADKLAKVSVLLLFFNSVGAIYWNNEFVKGDSNKKYFLSTEPNLNGLEIPSVVWDMPICDKECQAKERNVGWTEGIAVRKGMISVCKRCMCM